MPTYVGRDLANEAPVSYIVRVQSSLASVLLEPFGSPGTVRFSWNRSVLLEPFGSPGTNECWGDLPARRVSRDRVRELCAWAGSGLPLQGLGNLRR